MLKLLYFFTALISRVTRAARGVRLLTFATHIAKAHIQDLRFSREFAFLGLEIIFRKVVHEARSVRFVTVPVRNRPDGIISLQSVVFMAFCSKLPYLAGGVRLLLVECHEAEKRTLRRGLCSMQSSYFQASDYILDVNVSRCVSLTYFLIVTIRKRT